MPSSASRLPSPFPCQAADHSAVSRCSRSRHRSRPAAESSASPEPIQPQKRLRMRETGPPGDRQKIFGYVCGSTSRDWAAYWTPCWKHPDSEPCRSGATIQSSAVSCWHCSTGVALRQMAIKVMNILSALSPEAIRCLDLPAKVCKGYGATTVWLRTPLKGRRGGEPRRVSGISLHAPSHSAFGRRPLARISGLR